MATEWYYSKGEQRFGPVSVTELRQLSSSGDIELSDLVWKEGMSDWVPASKVKGLFAESARKALTSGASSAKDVGSSPSTVVALSDIESKWVGLYKRDLTLVELVIVELFHRLIPKDNSLYIFPNIPEKKWSNVKAGYANNVLTSELLLGLVDATAFGSATDGCLLTTQGVYCNSDASKNGHCTYDELRPAEVTCEAGWVRHKVILTSTLGVEAGTWFQPTAEGVATFVRAATQATLASKGHGPPAQVAAWGMLSEAHAKGKLDAVFSELTQQMLKEGGTGQADKSGTTGHAKEPLSKRSYQKAEDLDLLQADIAGWFKTKSYTVTTDKTNNLRVVLAGKESGLRNLLGARQKFLVKIEATGNGFTVEIGYGNFEEKGAGSNLATFLVNYATVGVPYIAGSVESQAAQDEFWKWMESRSGREVVAADKGKDAPVHEQKQAPLQTPAPATTQAQEESRRVVACVTCHESYNLDLTKYGGKKIKCKKCQGIIEVPLAPVDDEFEVVGEIPVPHNDTAHTPTASGISDPTVAKKVADRSAAIKDHAKMVETKTLSEPAATLFSGDAPCPQCKTLIWVEWQNVAVTLACPQCGFRFNHEEAIAFLSGYKPEDNFKADLAPIAVEQAEVLERLKALQAKQEVDQAERVLEQAKAVIAQNQAPPTASASQPSSDQRPRCPKCGYVWCRCDPTRYCSKEAYADCPNCGNAANVTKVQDGQVVHCQFCKHENYLHGWLNRRDTQQRVEGRNWLGRMFLGSTIQKSADEKRLEHIESLKSLVRSSNDLRQMAELHGDFQQAQYHLQKRQDYERRLNQLLEDDDDDDE